jgi:hypothetical protein
MEPDDTIQEQEKKIKSLELELNDLRQVSRQQVATEIVDLDIARPLVNDVQEFEGIWRFHEDVLVPVPVAHVPCAAMYEAFVPSFQPTGRSPVDKEASEFVFACREKTRQAFGNGELLCYCLRPNRR